LKIFENQNKKKLNSQSEISRVKEFEECNIKVIKMFIRRIKNRI
jgi:hypothetical protein